MCAVFRDPEPGVLQVQGGPGTAVGLCGVLVVSRRICVTAELLQP